MQEALFGSPERRERAVERPAPPDLEGESSHLREGAASAAAPSSAPASRPAPPSDHGHGPRANAGSLPPAASPGEGAQATVWLAHDPLLDREVAIKVLQPGTELGSVDEWRLHEARAVSRLNHPHIVPVFEADTQNGQSYLVFEYVEGGTLADRLRDHRRMPARRPWGCCWPCWMP